MIPSVAQSLFSAIEAGDLARVQCLVESDPSLLAAIVDDADPVGWAAFYAQPLVLRYLIDAGAPVNWRTPRGTTPLGFALKGAQGAFISRGVNRPLDFYNQCVAVLKSAGAIE